MLNISKRHSKIIRSNLNVLNTSWFMTRYLQHRPQPQCFSVFRHRSHLKHYTWLINISMAAFKAPVTVDFITITHFPKQLYKQTCLINSPFKIILGYSAIDKKIIKMLLLWPPYRINSSAHGTRYSCVICDTRGKQEKKMCRQLKKSQPGVSLGLFFFDKYVKIEERVSKYTPVVLSRMMQNVKNSHALCMSELFLSHLLNIKL